MRATGRLRNAVVTSKLLHSKTRTSPKSPMEANSPGSAKRSISSRRWMPSLRSSSISSSSADSPSPRLQPCVACRSARCSANGKKQKSISIASYAPIYCELSMSTLSPERWSALSPYLDKALTLSETERAVWLAALRAENPDLAGQLQELLNEHQAAQQEAFLETSPITLADNPGLAGQT